MTALSTAPLAVQDIPVNASDMRGLIGGLVLQDGVVVNSTAAILTQAATPAMSVVVKPFAAVISNSLISAAYENKQYVHSETDVELTVASAPGSGSRTDLVVARVYDTAFGAATSYAAVEVITGSTTLPDGAVELGRISVTAGQTSVLNSHITVSTRRVSLTGTELYCPTEAGRPTASTLPEGTRAFCQDYLSRWTVKSGAWVLVSAPALVGAAAADAARTTTTQAEVAGMSCPVAANATYEVRMHIYANAAASVDLAVALTVPSGSAYTGNKLGVLAPTGATTNILSTSMRAQAYSPTALTIGTDGTANDSYAVFTGLLVTGATAGSVAVTAASGASGTSTLRAGSYLTLVRVA